MTSLAETSGNPRAENSETDTIELHQTNQWSSDFCCKWASPNRWRSSKISMTLPFTPLHQHQIYKTGAPRQCLNSRNSAQNWDITNKKEVVNNSWLKAILHVSPNTFRIGSLLWTRSIESPRSKYARKTHTRIFQKTFDEQNRRTCSLRVSSDFFTQVSTCERHSPFKSNWMVFNSTQHTYLRVKRSWQNETKPEEQDSFVLDKTVGRRHFIPE